MRQDRCVGPLQGHASADGFSTSDMKLPREGEPKGSYEVTPDKAFRGQKLVLQRLGGWQKALNA